MESKQGLLELLAPELLQNIMIFLPDFDSLWNLLQASPHALHTFNAAALPITETILSSHGSLLPPKIQELIRAVILARACALPFQSLDEFHLDFIHGTLPKTNQINHTYYTLSPEILAAAAPSATIIISVISTACHISALTHACLASYLALVREPRIFAPQHCLNASFNYRARRDEEGRHKYPWQLKLRGQPFKITDAGPPSWVEQMRVRRALWIVQLVGEVRRAASNQASNQVQGLKWPRGDIDKMRLMSPEALAAHPTARVGPDEEIKTVNEYLIDLCWNYGAEHTYYRLPQPPPGITQYGWDTQQPEACEWTRGGRGCSYDYGYKTVIVEPTPEELELDIPILSTDANDLGQTRSALHSMVPSAEHFSLQYSSLSPLRGIAFDSFRRLGLAIWDRKRCHLLGLMNGIRTEADQGHPPPFYYFAWESLLSEEEVSKVKAVLEEEHRARQR